MHKHLKKLHVQNNFIKKYSPEFTEMVKAGLDVEYAGKYFTKDRKTAAFNATSFRNTHSTFQIIFSGNPLHCNCLLRPISYWLASNGRAKGRDGPWKRAKCATPAYYEGFSVDSLIEEQLICDETEEAAKFKVNPDIQFRDVSK